AALKKGPLCPHGYIDHGAGEFFILTVSKINMQPQAWDRHRAAIAVVSRIDNILKLGRGECSSPDVEVVVSLQNLLATVGQIAVSEQKTLATQFEIEGMVL